MNEVRDDEQEQQRPEEAVVSQRERETQAAVWALMLLIGEMSLAFRALRDRLQERGVLEPGDERLIDEVTSNGDNLRNAYAHVEGIFRDKYGKILHAMLNPGEVEAAMRQEELARKGAASTYDPAAPVASQQEGDN